MTANPVPSRADRRADLFAFVAIAIGAAIRCLGLGSEALWFDEVMSVEHLAGDTWQDVKGVLTRVDPPLYYAFLWAWIPLAGTSELALRLPSLVCGVAALWLLWRCGRAWFSPAAGAAATWLLAANPLAILYSQEARFYEALLLSGLLACLAFDRLVIEGGARRAQLAYAVAGAALFYLHFMGVLVVAAHALFLLRAPLAREVKRRALGAFFGVTVLVGPYLVGVLYLYLLEGAGHRDWIHRSGGPPGVQAVLATLAGFSGLMGPQLREPWPWIELPALLLVGIALLFAARAFGDAALEECERLRLRLHAWTLLAPPLLLALLSQTKSIYLDRYLIAGLPSAVLLAGYGLARAGACCAAARVALPLGASLAVLLPFLVQWPALRKADWPAALRALAAEASAGEVLLIDGPVDRPERASEGLDITTFHFYRRALEAERGSALPIRVVTLPFDLLRRGEWDLVAPQELAELERARKIERELLADSPASIWVAQTLDPWRSALPERPLEQTTLWKRLLERAGGGRAGRHPRLELWRFAPTREPAFR